MRKYYYVNEMGTQAGPVDITALSSLNIKGDTLVWYEGLSEWVPARTVAELAQILNPSVPPTLNAGFTPPTYNPMQNGYVNNYANPNQKPSSYMWLAILTTLLCCLPAGIVSIVYASKVDSCWVSGDYEGARYNSDKAKTWGIISAVAAAAVFVIYFAFVAACIPFI